MAEALRDWLPAVLQVVEPWLSSKDAAVGKRWADSLSKALEEARIGIFCLTKENIRAEWLQFEAGALSRLKDDALLCLYALDQEAIEIDGPLSQFQIVRADRDGTLGLVDGSAFDAPSTKLAVGLVDAWAKERPLVVVCADEDENMSRSFRNLQEVAVVAPSELDVAAVVWARSLLVSQAALSGLLARAGAGSSAIEEGAEETTS